MTPSPADKEEPIDELSVTYSTATALCSLFLRKLLYLLLLPIDALAGRNQEDEISESNLHRICGDLAEDFITARTSKERIYARQSMSLLCLIKEQEREDLKSQASSYYKTVREGYPFTVEVTLVEENKQYLHLSLNASTYKRMLNPYSLATGIVRILLYSDKEAFSIASNSTGEAG